MNDEHQVDERQDADIELIAFQQSHELCVVATIELFLAEAPEQAIQLFGIGRAEAGDRIADQGGGLGVTG
jgi:hypothetical protein